MSETNLQQLPRELRQLHTRGAEAAQRENLDYAVALFTQVLDKEPRCHEVRAALRAVQQKKSGGQTGGFFKRAFNNTASSPQLAKARMALNKNPLEAIAIAETVLATDPQNLIAHGLIADAATAEAMPHTAALSLEILTRQSPNDTALTVLFARALSQSGDVVRAERIMADLCRANPGNPEFAMELKDISASKTLSEGGYETLGDGDGSYRDILKNKEEAVSLEQEKRVQKTDDVTARLIGEYEARLASEGNNLKLLRNLAELYTEKKRFDEALEYYGRIKASEGGNDPSLDQAIAKTTVRKFDHAIAELNPFAPDREAQIANLQAEKLAFQIAECQSRVDRYPTDLAIRFEMGALNFQAGKISEAIQDFQKSQSNPHKRVASMNYLAQCFAKRKMFDLASKTLQSAIREKPVLDDEKKDLIYNLGCVTESMGKKDEAIEQFKLLYEVDIGYRDVAAKVDAFYAAQ